MSSWGIPAPTASFAKRLILIVREVLFLTPGESQFFNSDVSLWDEYSRGNSNQIRKNDILGNERSLRQRQIVCKHWSLCAACTALIAFANATLTWFSQLRDRGSWIAKGDFAPKLGGLSALQDLQSDLSSLRPKHQATPTARGFQTRDMYFILHCRIQNKKKIDLTLPTVRKTF